MPEASSFERERSLPAKSNEFIVLRTRRIALTLYLKRRATARLKQQQMRGTRAAIARSRRAPDSRQVVKSGGHGEICMEKEPATWLFKHSEESS
jgi:hypothetical protein